MNSSTVLFRKATFLFTCAIRRHSFTLIRVNKTRGSFQVSSKKLKKLPESRDQWVRKKEKGKSAEIREKKMKNNCRASEQSGLERSSFQNSRDLKTLVKMFSDEWLLLFLLLFFSTCLRFFIRVGWVRIIATFFCSYYFLWFMI